MKKNFLTTLTGLLLSINLFAYSGGNGSEAFPYLISSRADMTELATAVNGGQKYAGVYFKLTRDLTGSADIITTTIGSSSSNYFSGVFDGGGYEIAINGGAVFGQIQNATIKNLGVSGRVTSVSYNIGSGPYHYYIGGLCANAVSSNISNCYNKASVSYSGSFSTAGARNFYAGGICGYASACTIANCYNTGSIYISPTASTTDSYAGGICGATDDKVTNINNCYNTATISSTANSPNATSTYAYAGGICGSGNSSNLKITNCYNTGNVSATTQASYREAYSGGICGRYGAIQNCFVADCRITNTNDATRVYIGRVGGAYGTYTNSYAYGMITLNGNAISSTNANSKNGQDCTTANLQTQSWLTSNLSWSFTNTWVMPAGNGSYPELKDVGGQGTSIGPTVIVTANTGNATLGSTLGSGTYDRNSSVTIYAVPLANNVFVAWSDDNTNNPRTITAADNITLTAIFDACDNTDLLTQIAALEADTAALNSQLNTANGTISTLQNDLNTANGTITTLKADTVTLKAQIAGLQSDLSDCETAKTVLQNDLSTCETSKTILQSDLDTANSLITELQDDLSDCEEEVIRLLSEECGTTRSASIRSESVISVFPNPTTGVVYFNAVNNVKVYSQQGALLQEKTGDSVDLSNYASGVYLLRVGSEWVKVVKK